MYIEVQYIEIQYIVAIHIGKRLKITVRKG